MTDPQPVTPAAQAVSDAERVEAAAAVLERRYPAARPEVLDVTISELHSIARAWRRIAGSPQADSPAGLADDPSRVAPAILGQQISRGGDDR